MVVMVMTDDIPVCEDLQCDFVPILNISCQIFVRAKNVKTCRVRNMKYTFCALCAQNVYFVFLTFYKV
jgi:hypothetical protein